MIISTHVLDTTRGRPAAGLAVTLRRRGADGEWSVVGRAVTDADGRIKDLASAPLAAGDYRLEFATG
jgi:5-hydroxyisourate hydrolase